MRHRRIALAFVALAAALVVSTRWTGAPMTAARSPLRTVPLPGQPIAVAADARTGHVFVTTVFGSVSMLDAATGAVARTVTVGVNAQALAVSDATMRAFVVDPGYGRASYTVGVLDARTGRAFVNTRTGVYVLDTRTGALSRVVPVDGALLALDATTDRVFAVNNVSGALAILDARDGRVVGTMARTVPAGDNPINLAVDGTHGRVAVIADNADGGSVAVLDARTGKPLRTLVMGSDPAAVAVDGTTGHVFVASAGDGEPRAAQPWRAVPAWLRWLPFVPQWTPPKAPGSIGMLVP